MSLDHIHYELTLFSRGDDRDQAEIDLTWFLEALTQRDQDYIRQRPKTPRLYRSGVKYIRPAQALGECEEVRVLRQAFEACGVRPSDNLRLRATLQRVQDVFGGEHFCDIGVILRLGGIDCDGLGSWRSAELRQRGIKATPAIIGRDRPDGGTTYHVVVRWPKEFDIGGPDGLIEDPSLLLGMGGPARAADRAWEIRKNAMRAQLIRERRQAKIPRVVDSDGLITLDAADIDAVLQSHWRLP